MWRTSNLNPGQDTRDGVEVGTECASAEAQLLLPRRRMCVSVRPVLAKASPNASDYKYDEKQERWVKPA